METFNKIASLLDAEKKDKKKIKKLMLEINETSKIMAEILILKGSRAKDIWLAKIMRQLWHETQLSLKNKEVFKFWSEFVPKLAESYPITIRAIWAEVHIYNFELKRTADRGYIEDIYFKLLK